MTIRRILSFVYALAVLASNLVIWLRPPAALEPGAALRQTVRIVDSNGVLSASDATIAYNDSGPRAAPVMLLIHGSPGSASNFDQLTPLLESRYRVISIDLPGFGASTERIPDYSFRAHAHYVLQLMDALAIDRVHLVGFSMGGGVVLSMADIAPARVRSIVMLSAIGAQEFELLGDFHLNRAVHGLQHGALWLLYHGIPHFGALPTPLTFTRNFYDSDQRPLRGILARYEAPMLIFQGREDPLVPYEAALEHARLAPQAELKLIESSHFMIFDEPQRTAQVLLPFFDQVDAGRAATRATASPERIAAAAQALDVTRLPGLVGIALIAAMALLAAATFVSEDLACIGAGVLAAQGRIDFIPAALACFLGIFTGDVLTMLAGRWLGRSALNRAPLKWLLSASAVDRSARWFQQRETAAIFLSRLIPGSRVATYFAAGIFSKRPWWIVLCLAAAAALWAPALVGAAMLLGEQFVEELLLGSVLWNLLLAALGLYLALQILRTLATHRSRRLLLSTYKRWRHWEFWPMWLFYPPVIAWVLWLAIKHRGLAFTACNPGIPASGIVGESKRSILQALDDGGRFVAPSMLILRTQPIAQQLAQAQAFMHAQGLTYPVALKPDAGERGVGVSIARCDAALEHHLRNADEHTVIQAYVATGEHGGEYGVFYYRYPDETQGRIFRITDKRMPILIGDGKRTLERLILDDARAVAMAQHYIDAQGASAMRVPAAGERVQLVELGTHSRGAIFLDGTALLTPALTQAIDAISQRFDGFFFGRYDIRTPSVSDFQRGENFKVIELNGVTSEATSIYDPKYSVIDAYRTLFEQWHIAYDIGAANLRRGTQRLGLRALIQLLRTRGRGLSPDGARRL